MNLVLLDSPDTRYLLAGTPSAAHLLRVLKISVGGSFWCGVKNGLRGLATVSTVSASGDIGFDVVWEKGDLLRLPPVRLLVGLSRPQTMKKIFAVASEIGCSRIDVFRSEKGDPAYAESSIWKSGDETLFEILKKSAEQTCVPAIPEFALHESLSAFLRQNYNCPGENDTRIALDVYAEKNSFGDLSFPSGNEVLLAIGSERGWSGGEREALRGSGFVFAHLGARVLRVETAVSVALAVALSKTESWAPHKVLAV